MIRGKDIVIYENGAAIAAARSCDINFAGEAKETSSPFHPAWRSYVKGRKEWSVTVNYLVNGLKDKCIHIGSVVTLALGVAEEGEMGTDRLVGQAICVDARVTATVGNLSQGTWVFKGNGGFEETAAGLRDVNEYNLLDAAGLTLRSQEDDGSVVYDLNYEGAVIQAILDTGKTLKDKGYIYLGTASKTYTGDQPQERVFYIGTPGTYIGYGKQFSVAQGSLAVIKWTTDNGQQTTDGGQWKVDVLQFFGEDGKYIFDGDVEVTGTSIFKQSVHALMEIVLGLNAEGKDKVLRSAIYEAGMKGWAVDKNGNAELESLKVRGYLETEELRINRLQGQEGDTIFTDNDKIEAVEEEVDETDGTTYYTLTLAEKWEGYFTAQKYGNICKGIVNTLAENYLAQQQGREPSVDINASGQEADAGGNKYFTSWFYVVATHNTDSGLGLNQIRVVLFGESQIPQDKNFAPCVGMSFGRWGCLDYATDGTPDYELADIKRRQSLFYISVSEGRIMHLKGVNKPILESWMFGTTMGELPDFVKNNESIKDRLVDNADYFYSQGVVVSDFIKIGATGMPVPVTWFCGDWVDGSTIDNPTIGNGIYLASEYNPENRQYEVHEVRHKSGRWRCLQHQPVVMNGEAVYHEPKWNSHYWRLVDGNENYSILFQSSRGMSFHRGHVDTEVTPRLMYGNVDISEDVAEQFWSWKRYTDTGETLADKAWSAQHEGVKVLHLTNEDMPQEWNSRNRAIFEVSVTLDDGITQTVISNYIIA